MSSSNQARRKRLVRVVVMLASFGNHQDADDIDSLLRTERELRRELSACKKALRHLQGVQARDADSAIILQAAFVELRKKGIKL